MSDDPDDQRRDLSGRPREPKVLVGIDRGEGLAFRVDLPMVDVGGRGGHLDGLCLSHNDNVYSQ